MIRCQDLDIEAVLKFLKMLFWETIYAKGHHTDRMHDCNEGDGYLEVESHTSSDIHAFVAK